MNIRNLFFILFMSATLYSCFEDKGNYEYNHLYKVEVKTTESTSLIVGESVKLKAEVKAEPSYKGTLLYEWMINSEVVSDGEECTFEAKKIGNFSGFLRVYDKDTKQSFVFQFIIIVSPDYETGFVVLSETPDGNSEVSIIRSAKTKGDYYNKGINDTIIYKQDFLNLYETLNGEKLIGKPLSVKEHYAKDDYNTIFGEVMIGVENNGVRNYVELNGLTMEREAFITQEFTTDGLPTEFKPKHVIHTCWDSFILDYNGLIYNRRQDKKEAYHVGRFDKSVALYAGTKFTDLMETYYPKARALFAIEKVSDGKGGTQRNYVGIYVSESSADRNLTKLKFSSENPNILADFVDVKEEVLMSDYYRALYDDNGYQVVILKDKDNNNIMHYFETELVGYTGVRVTYSQKFNLTKDFGMNSIVDVVASKNKENPYTYICSEDKIIWFHNVNHGFGEIATVEGRKISAMAIQGIEANVNKRAESDLILGYEDGSVDIFQFRLDNHEEFRKRVYSRPAGTFGKIKDITYKIGNAAFYFSS